jgi:hypothetical protein
MNSDDLRGLLSIEIATTALILTIYFMFRDA